MTAPEPLAVCPRCGRHSSHDHDVAAPPAPLPPYTSKERHHVAALDRRARFLEGRGEAGSGHAALSWDLAEAAAIRWALATLDAARQPAPDDAAALAQRNDMGRVLALALSSQGYASTDSEAVGLALLREIEEQGYTLRLTTPEERRARNAKGESS